MRNVFLFKYYSTEAKDIGSSRLKMVFEFS